METLDDFWELLLDKHPNDGIAAAVSIATRTALRGLAKWRTYHPSSHYRSYDPLLNSKIFASRLRELCNLRRLTAGETSAPLPIESLRYRVPVIWPIQHGFAATSASQLQFYCDDFQSSSTLQAIHDYYSFFDANNWQPKLYDAVFRSLELVEQTLATQVGRHGHRYVEHYARLGRETGHLAPTAACIETRVELWKELLEAFAMDDAALLLATNQSATNTALGTLWRNDTPPIAIETWCQVVRPQLLLDEANNHALVHWVNEQLVV